MYNSINAELENRMREDKKAGRVSEYACLDENVIRRREENKSADIWRMPFVRDVEKIMHCPYYNRYSDKTQVLSFYKNDDITRRALHVQYVARIARNIGRALGLNEDLIEAVALGHDIGHTPFGHAGERFLNELYYSDTSRYFNHNVHSVRVLDGIFGRNLSLQVLDGILCHNGELELEEYRPAKSIDFAEFDEKIEACYRDKAEIKKLVPTTLEGCVVRISDIIAYLGKDRQDAYLAKILPKDFKFPKDSAGDFNAELINNFTVNIIENSYGKPYIKMDEAYFTMLKKAKNDNYRFIYNNEKLENQYNQMIRPMFADIYEKLTDDMKKKDETSVIFTHHINYINQGRNYYNRPDYVKENSMHDIVVDYIASMTDDYFVDLYAELFPEKKCGIEYVSYFA